MMSDIDVDSLVLEVDSDAPTGADLEYDADFMDLEQASSGAPERWDGDKVIPREDPDWPEMRDKALALFPRTKDLRVAVHLMRALLRTGGWIGLRDGAAVLHQIVERYWDSVHPELDADDDNDPTRRINTLMSLCDSEFMLRDIRETPIVAARVSGRFSLRDVDIASGKLAAPEGVEPAQPAQISAAFQECDSDEVQADLQAAAETIEHIAAIETFVTAQVGAANAANFAPLRDVLHEVKRVFADNVGEPGSGDADEVEAAAGGENAPAAGVSGQIRTREDALRMMDKICDYFTRNEPSSPVPILLQRAKRVVGKDFIELMRDLAPDGLSQAEMFRGESSAGED